MNKSRFTINFLLLFLVIASTCNAEGPLKVIATDKWEIEYKNQGDTYFYSVSYKDTESALLMLSNQPYNTNPSGFNQIQSDTIEFYLSKAEERLKSDSAIIKVVQQKIKGISFSGNSVNLFNVEGFIQTLFIISNGEILLNGQFTGSEEKWEEALKILEKLK